uniref:Retrotransposon gag domain-containing protein n=1 Tax=Tanacetum cinerariifolium TaxID=118510 RepID=A0A6L2MJ74_TANCI|nr:hypothetical protein [Tanacetum cinerariifolium]
MGGGYLYFCSFCGSRSGLLGLSPDTRDCLQALIDKKKVIFTEDTVRQALRLDDAKSIDCLPNEEIFAEFARMGYKKPSTKTASNEFSSSMASAVICLATGRKYNFSKYIFDRLVRNVDSSSKFYWVGKGFSGVDTPLFEGMLVPQQVQVDIDAVAEDEDATEPTLPTPATTSPPQQELIPSTSHVVPTLPPSPHQSRIAQPSSPQQQQPSQTTDIFMDLLNILLETCTTLTKRVENLEQEKIDQALEITKLKHKDWRLEHKMKLKASGFKILTKGKITEVDADEDVTLEEVAAEVPIDADIHGRLNESQAPVYHLDLEHAQKVLSMQDDEAEAAELKEVIEVVTTAKLTTEVVTATATTITATPSAARRRKGIVIRDPKEIATSSVIVHSEPKSKDKGKGILVEKPKPLKKQAHIEVNEAYARGLEAELSANINWNEVIEQVKRKEKQDNTVLRYQSLKRKPQTKAYAKKNIMVYLKIMAGFKMQFFKCMSYDDIIPIFEKNFNSIVAFLEKGEEGLEEEAIKQSKRKSETSEEKAAKKQKLDEEVKELKTHLQIVPHDEDDVEDLEMLWKIIQERFLFSKSKNFSDDFLLNTLKAMSEKPNVKASIWKSHSDRYGLAKVKSWNLLESCGVHIITLRTTQMILLVERRYPLTRFTLDQMLNNVRLEVEEESEVSLELLRFVRKQQQEGYRLDFGVDAVENFKGYMLRDYYCWLKAYFYSHADPTLLNDFEMAAEGNGDPSVPDLRTMAELCQPSLNGRGRPIAPIAIQATNFRLKNDMIQQVHNSCQFHGLPGHDAKKHLDKFLHTHHAIAWVDRLSRNLINTFEKMAKMFLGKYFPPSMVTKLRNEITNFRQHPDESLFEAWECYKLSIDRYPNHNMFSVTQIDTFYNGLTLRHRDTINTAAGGTFMKRHLEECSLKAEMAKIKKNLMRVLQVNQKVKAVTPCCETCGGPHSFTNCPATVGQTQNRNNQGRNQFFQGASHGQNLPLAYQASSYQASGYQDSVHQPQIPQPQVVTTIDFTNFMKLNDAILKNMQTNMTSLTNSNLELKNVFGQFMKMNTASSSGSRTLPGNTIMNPKEELKGITTRSGTAYQGPMIPTSSSSSLPQVVECETEAKKDTVPPTNNGSTKDVQPSVVQTETPIQNSKHVVASMIDPVVAPVSALKHNQKLSIPYPSRFLDFDISFADALILMPKFRQSIKSLLTNKDKLYEPAKTPPNEHCSSVLLKNDFLLEEVDAFLALEDDPTSPKVDQCYFDPKGDILILEAFLNDDPSLPPPNQGNYLPQDRKEFKICKAKADKSSIDEPPEVELKYLPPHLEYAFFEGDDKLPVIIVKDLSNEEKAALKMVFMSHKRAIAWKLFDIKGIDPKFCTHKNVMEDDFEPVVQHQSRVNPKIHVVIKNEVLKLFDAGLIYTISDSPWIKKRPHSCVLTERLPTVACLLGYAMHRARSKEKMLKRCEDTNLCLNWEKSHFMVKEGIVLGHKISKNGIEVDKAKVDVISKFPHLTTVKGNCSFLGHAGLY